MRFYEVTADLLNTELPLDDSQKQKFSENLKVCSAQYLSDSNDSVYFFVSHISGRTLTAGLLVSDLCYNVDGNCLPWDKMQLRVDNVEIRETCSSDFFVLLNGGSRNNFSVNARRILSQFGLRSFCSPEAGLFSESDAYKERLIDASISAEALRVSARSLFWDRDAIPEFERIEMPTKIEGISGHPVHYVFCSDDDESLEEIVYSLLSSLYQNRRLQIKRACRLNISKLAGRDLSCLDKLYRCYDGGAVILRYCEDTDEEAGEACVTTGTIEEVCSVIKANKNRVLTVLCFPSSCSKEQAQFFSYLENTVFLTLKENDVDETRALEYLRQKAARNQCPSCDTLLCKITAQRSYRVSELNRIFSEWMDTYIKTEVYPQYKELLPISSKYAMQKPLGSAYDKLQRMVGLQQVKSIIDSALDYFKAQRLFKTKGVFCQNPSMHMVFTGNPGTAKTTVARLLAEILRDNGVLSSGHLVEVGRSDLVGKYVGWTAKTVKAKFKEAQGGILFIDEAYSLVDDRAGLYGDEAINTIVQEMENNRGDLVVVFAGYPDKMSLLLDKNPGLRSRILFHIPFADYSADELCRIAELMVEERQLQFDNGVREKLSAIFDEAIKHSDFGNGRYVRNLLEKATMHQATRLIRRLPADAIFEANINALIPEDFVPEQTLACKKETRTIGFSA